MRVDRFFLTVVLAAAVSACAVAQSPIDILRKSIDARRNTLASLIQSQSLVPTSEERILMKVELDGKGRIRRTMLQPLRFQGQVMIDDGKSILAFAPDAKELTVMSSAIRPLASAFRIEQISKNYRLSARKVEPIAGRTTVLITCRPVHKGMPWRRVSVDQKTSLPLRIVSTLDSKATTLLDTLSFDEPKSMPDSLFRAPQASEVKIIRLAGPTRVQSEEEAAERLDFRPWVPKGLPMGFAAEAMEVNSSGLAIRLTDGFHSVTLYQWDASAKTPGFGGLSDSDSFVSRGLRMAVIGDVPESIVQRIIENLRKESLNL